MDRVRTGVGIAVAVLLIAWLTRSPATEADFGPQATDTPSPQATPGPTDTATPPDTAPPTPDLDTLSNVAVLNPVTLSVLTATVATLSPDWTASPPPQPLVLLEPAQGIARTVT
ncbi:MAG: hypothetical protein ACR2HR_12155, partial [Euzebya sp.]